MKKIAGLLLISLISTVFLTGCATNFPNPIRSCCTKTPTIRIVQQGSVPATFVYRSNLMVLGTNANSRFFLPPDVIAQLIASGLTVISDITDKTTERYYDTLKNNYRWRTDIFISGITNFTDAQIVEILDAGTKPQFDGQRPSTLLHGGVPIK